MAKTREELIEKMEQLADLAQTAGDFQAAIRATQLAGLNHGLFTARADLDDDEFASKSIEELEAIRTAVSAHGRRA